MINKDLNGSPEIFLQSLNKELCPVCSASMTEVHRCRENGAWFVWHECGRSGCDGQWLQKISQEALNKS